MTSIEKARSDFLRGQYKEWGVGRPADLPGAARLYRRAAMRGLPEAQHALAFLYATGQGVPADEVMAAAWFRRAAVQGHAPSQHNLGVMYAEGRGVELDEQEAIYWFYRAAIAGCEVSRDWLTAARSAWRERIAGDM